MNYKSVKQYFPAYSAYSIGTLFRLIQDMDAPANRFEELPMDAICSTDKPGCKDVLNLVAELQKAKDMLQTLLSVPLTKDEIAAIDNAEEKDRREVCDLMIANHSLHVQQARAAVNNLTDKLAEARNNICKTCPNYQKSKQIGNKYRINHKRFGAWDTLTLPSGRVVTKAAPLSTLKVWLSLPLVCGNVGYTDGVDIRILSELTSLSDRSVKRALADLAYHGLIKYKKVCIPLSGCRRNYYISITDDIYAKARDGGSGFIRLSFDAITDILKSNNVEVLRVALAALIGVNEQAHLNQITKASAKELEDITDNIFTGSIFFSKCSTHALRQIRLAKRTNLSKLLNACEQQFKGLLHFCVDASNKSYNDGRYNKVPMLINNNLVPLQNSGAYLYTNASDAASSAVIQVIYDDLITPIRIKMQHKRGSAEDITLDDIQLAEMFNPDVGEEIDGFTGDFLAAGRNLGTHYIKQSAKELIQRYQSDISAAYYGQLRKDKADATTEILSRLRRTIGTLAHSAFSRQLSNINNFQLA